MMSITRGDERKIGNYVKNQGGKEYKPLLQQLDLLEKKGCWL